MRNSKAHDQHQVLSQKSSKTTTSFQMKEDDKFFSRLLSKEESSNKSFRLSLAIPFQWESEPGTPKHYPFSDHQTTSNIPTLTPPPSYYFTPKKKNNYNKKPSSSSSSRFNLFHTLFPKFNPKIRSSSSNKNSTSFINDLSSSLAVSFRVVPMAKLGRRRRLLSFGSSSSSSFDFRGGDDDCGSHNSSTSMCFGGVHRTNSCSRRA